MADIVNYLLKAINVAIPTSFGQQDKWFANDSYLGYIRSFDFFSILQVADALAYVHNSEQMLHNNICPSSILINRRGIWKLGGFSFAVRSRDGRVCL